MKTISRISIRFFTLSLIFIGCHEDDNVMIIEPEVDNNITSITRGDLEVEGIVENTSNGYIIDGTLTMRTDSLDVVFNKANLDVQFNNDGTLRSIEGESEIPPSPFFQIDELEDPIKADVNFYTGKYINENFDLEILLVEDITYFIFSLEIGLKVNILIDGERISLEPPLGGHVSFVSDYNDPMFFWSVGADIFGSLAFGRSYLGQLPFAPSISVENVVEFDAKSVKGGEFGFAKILTAKGMLYENKILDATIDLNNIEETNLVLGYHSGLNGTISVGIPGFEIQIAEGSYSVITEGSNQDGIIAKGFFNGVIDPDLSWWPKLIPMKPDGQLSADGYVTHHGNFDFGISGSFEIETPTLKEKIEGVMRSSEKITFIDGQPVTKKHYTMEGKVSKNDEVWGARATFTNDSTLYIASPPEGFLNGVSSIVSNQIDSTFAVHEKALENLKEATENYEIELSLRGLKKEIDLIVDEAFKIIDESVTEGIKEGRKRADDELDKHNRKRCSDNIPSIANSIVKPYKDALTKLRNAVTESDTNDVDATRTALEEALRDLIKLKKIDKTVSATVWSDWKFTGCFAPREDNGSVGIDETIIPSKYVDILNRAADNVKYISEASNIKIETQRIVDELPSLEELETLRNNIESCVSDIVNNIGDVGFIKDHKTGEFTYFIMVNGERMEVSGFNVFDKDTVIEVSRGEFNSCSIN